MKHNLTIAALRKAGYKVRVLMKRPTKTRFVPTELHPAPKNGVAGVLVREVAPKGGVTILQIRHPDGREVKTQSYCAAADAFVKKIGVSIALGRIPEDFLDALTPKALGKRYSSVKEMAEECGLSSIFDRKKHFCTKVRGEEVVSLINLAIRNGFNEGLTRYRNIDGEFSLENAVLWRNRPLADLIKKNEDVYIFTEGQKWVGWSVSLIPDHNQLSNVDFILKLIGK